MYECFVWKYATSLSLFTAIIASTCTLPLFVAQMYSVHTELKLPLYLSSLTLNRNDQNIAIVPRVFFCHIAETTFSVPVLLTYVAF